MTISYSFPTVKIKLDHFAVFLGLLSQTNFVLPPSGHQPGLTDE